MFYSSTEPNVCVQLCFLYFLCKILYGINECKKKITVFLNFSELRIVNIVGSFSV